MTVKVWRLLIVCLIALFVGGGIMLYQRGSNAVADLDAQIAQLGSIDRSGDTLYEWADAEALVIASGLRGFTLPEDVGDFQLARQGLTRPTYWLRFSLSATSLGSFLASTCLPALSPDPPPDFRYGRDASIIANLPWWEPEQVQQASGAACTDSSGVTFRLLADTDAMQVTLYMEISPGSGP